MVAVGVGAQDRGDLGIADSAQDRLDMTFSVDIGRVADALAAARRAGVDDGDVAARTNQPGLRSSKGIRRRIRCEHTADQRLMLFGFACVDSVGPVHANHVACSDLKKQG